MINFNKKLDERPKILLLSCNKGKAQNLPQVVPEQY